MGKPMFEFEDDFVDSVCMGLSDAESKQRLVAAFEQGRVIMERSVQERVKASPDIARYAEEIGVALEHGSYVVVVPERIRDEVMGHELGDGSTRPQPALRGGLIHGAGPAGKAITDGLRLG